MKIKIVSNGMVAGTKVVNAETGESIEGVQSLRWELDIRSGFATAYVKFVTTEIEAEGDLIETTVGTEGTP